VYEASGMESLLFAAKKRMAARNDRSR
jgi:hypothetical protein